MVENRLVKTTGSVYTPPFLVKIILDFGGYSGEEIVRKHVMDNSCGDGAFLKEIVRRYCSSSRENSVQAIKNELETFIHGIEINAEECEKAKRNLDSVALDFGIKNVKWDVQCADALACYKEYQSKMDYVFGNPPYVRVHNLAEKYDAVKKFSFAGSGMTDLYIVFFEIGLEMLSENGTMTLITPSSWLTSVSGVALREYIRENDVLNGLIDLGHFQAFDAMTYTLISRFCKTSEIRKIRYLTLSGENGPEGVDCLSLADMDIAGNFYLGARKELQRFRKILENKRKSGILVKNGFATLADKVFVGNVDCENSIDAIKGSTGKWKRCVFPYSQNGTPIPFEKLGEKTQKYLLGNKNALSDHGDGDWFLFGRSQGLKDVSKDKISVNTIIKDISTIKLNWVPAGKGVYSGLYILTDFPLEKIREAICCDDFLSYLKMLKKYKSGGYYTFSSKDLETYLRFSLGEEK